MHRSSPCPRTAATARPDHVASNTKPLSLHVPVPYARPGEAPDFSHVDTGAPGTVSRPDIGTDPALIRDHVYGLIRVLGDEAQASGPWNPELSPETLIRALTAMLTTRVYDDRMYKMQRQGKTSFYVKCLGEEAVAVGAALALDERDMCFSTYRQQGLLVTRGYPLVQMMNQIYSNSADPLLGRQLPVMYSSKEFGFFSISGNLATQYPQAVGWAMASAYKGDTRIAASWVGDGSTAEGDFHSACTFAAVYRAPVILNIVNNQWAISSFSGIAGGQATTFAARALAYGLPGLRVDGNDLLAVYAAHAVGRRTRPREPRRDDHRTFHLPRRRPQHVGRSRPLPPRRRGQVLALGRSRPPPEGAPHRHARLGRCPPRRAAEPSHRNRPRRQPRGGGERHARHRPRPRSRHHVRGHLQGHPRPHRRTARRGGVLAVPTMNMIQAINSALDVAMARDPDVVVFGEDVGYFGGVFRATEGLQAKYGLTRCFDAPIAEGGIIAAAVGMGAYGLRPVPEIQFSDYIYPGLDQLVSEAARLRYRSNGMFTAPITVRSPVGGGIFGGQTHSQSPEALFTHIVGLKTVIPSTPYDAKGLLLASIEDDDPVMFFEPKRIYNGPFDGHHDRPVQPWSKHPSSEVPDGHYTIPLGKAAVVREGGDVTMLAYGTMVHVALASADAAGVDAEVIDLRTLLPLDTATIVESVRKTGRCVIVHEATRTGGFGAELSATVQERCFEYLEAPILRVTGWDTPYPHAFEWNYFPGPARIVKALRAVMED